MKKNEKGFSVVEVMVITIVIVLVGAVGWLLYDKQQVKTNKAQDVSQPNKQALEKKKVQRATPESQQAVVISDDVVICEVNTAAQSGAGLKVAFYGYVKGDDYSRVWIEYGTSANDLDKKTIDFPNGKDDTCTELLASMQADELPAGKYYYRAVASKDGGAMVYSKTASFNKQ